MATITKASVPFQAQVLAWVLRHDAALAQVRNELSVEFWQNATHKKIASIAYSYFDTYEGVPSENTMRALIDDMLFNEEAEVSRYVEYGEVLTFLYKELLKDDAEVSYLKANLEPLIRKRLTEIAIVGSVGLIDSGNFEKIQSDVETAANFRLEKNDRVINWSSYDRSFYLPTPGTAPIATLFTSIDEELHGGLHPGELGLVCAPPGTGKSQFLVNAAVSAMFQGKYVLFVTLEMGERDITRRMDSCISEIPYWDLENPDKNQEAKQKISEWASEHGGDCDVLFFPQQSISVPQLKMLIKKMYRNKKFPDLIVVDYADLFSSTTEYKNSYDNQGQVYGQLVALAGEFQIPCWSASQINREGAKSKVKQMEHLADSYKKAMVANVIYTINQDENEAQSKMLRLYSVKVRNGEKYRYHYFTTKFECSKLVPTTEDSYTAIKNSPDFGGGVAQDLNKTLGTKGWSSTPMINLLNQKKLL